MTPWFEYPRQQWQERHAIVVGAGIAGCQVSWHLASLGWRVTLLECKERVSSQASGNLAGIISPIMSAKASRTEQFYQQAFEYTVQHLKELISSGQDVDWFDCGLLQLAHSERERQRWNRLKARNLDPELIQLIDQQQATETAGIHCPYPASYFPKAGFINPESWCNAIIKNAKCEVILDANGVSLTFNENRNWSVIDHTGDSLATAEVVVLSNGKDLNQFSQSKQLDLTHVLGQTTLALPNDFSSHLKCAINHEGYITPSYRDKHVFGATFNREYEGIHLTQDADTQNLNQLYGHFPTLAASFDKLDSGHASVRSATPDRLPYMGGLPDISYYLEHYGKLKHGNKNQTYPNAQYQKGLFILGGLGSRGLTSSPLCAKALSELINNQLSIDSLTLLKKIHPARFLIRQLKRGLA